MDGHLRSVVKAITWRILGTFDTIVITFLISGKLGTAFSVGGVELVSKIFLYYVHERIWSKVLVGKA